MSYHLHVVSFDVPFPANYGGVIDVYYKLVWLHKSGVKIHLHCFKYGRAPSKQLEDICEKVYYYPRKTGMFSNLLLLPYTVASRRSKELKKNLLADDHPILFEVLHTCFLLKDHDLAGRKKIYRHSNLEHEYYMELSRTEKSLVKRIYLKIESRKLKAFESILKFADLILAVNKKDTAYFHGKFPSVRSVYLPSFHANDEVRSVTGTGNYILFHGNLSVSENYEAAGWLVRHVFSKIGERVIIAGLKPPAFLEKLILPYTNIELRINPREEEMEQLVRDAQVHVLYTAQPTGLKLKLLNVLFAGRFVVCNENMLSGTGLAQNGSLAIADSATEIISVIHAKMNLPFTAKDIEERKKLVAPFENALNAGRLVSEIFQGYSTTHTS